MNEFQIIWKNLRKRDRQDLLEAICEDCDMIIKTFAQISNSGELDTCLSLKYQNHEKNARYVKDCLKLDDVDDELQ